MPVFFPGSHLSMIHFCNKQFLLGLVPTPMPHSCRATQNRVSTYMYWDLLQYIQSTALLCQSAWHLVFTRATFLNTPCVWQHTRTCIYTCIFSLTCCNSEWLLIEVHLFPSLSCLALSYSHTHLLLHALSQALHVLKLESRNDKVRVLTLIKIRMRLHQFQKMMGRVILCPLFCCNMIM